MSTSGGSGGGTNLAAIGKYVTNIPAYGMPGFEDPIAGDDSKGWIALKADASFGEIVAGYGSTGAIVADIVTASNGPSMQLAGATTADITMQAKPANAYVHVTADVGQTSAVLLLRDTALAKIVEVTGDKKIGVFAAAPVVQQANIPDASGGAIIDAEARTAINAALALLLAYGWMHS